MKKEELINTLVDDLEEFTPVRTTLRVVLFWHLTLFFSITLWGLWVVGFRPNIGSQLLSSPRFFAEVLCGVVLVFLLTWKVLGSSIPGYKTKAISIAIKLIGSLLVGLFLYSLYDPSLSVSMVGKRPNCFYEGIVFGTIVALSLFTLLRFRAVFERLTTGILIGVVGVLASASFMHVACMYDPVHVLVLHVTPVFIVSAVAALVVRLGIKTP